MSVLLEAWSSSSEERLLGCIRACYLLQIWLVVVISNALKLIFVWFIISESPFGHLIPRRDPPSPSSKNKALQTQ